MEGKIIIGYTLRKRLGIGGMAEVWYAENKIGKNAAVKILLPELSQNESIIERFIAEAKTMVMLDHPNIRQVYDYGDIDGRPAIVMEYLDGEDLKARLKRGQHFSDEELVKWWDQLVDALNYTHKKGVIHRDIKPGNIFVDAKGDIKLLDFGIAKVRESISSTQTGQKLGTLMYMSPEQVKDSKNINYKSDIYSLAVTFVHLLTGKKPYDSDTSSDFEISEQIVYKPLDLAAVPATWRAFLEPYLAKEPQNRPDLKPFEIVQQAPAAEKPEVDDEATICGDAVDAKPKEKPAEVKPEVKKENVKKEEVQKEKPEKTKKSKKGLWIVLILLVVGAVVAVVFVMKPEDNATVSSNNKDSYEEDEEMDLDTRTYWACATLEDYQAYIKEYGRNANYYNAAKSIIEDYDREYYNSCVLADDFLNYISIFGSDALYYDEALDKINNSRSSKPDPKYNQGSQTNSYETALTRGDWRTLLNKCCENGKIISGGYFKGTIDPYTNGREGMGMMGWPTINTYYFGEFANDKWEGIGIYINEPASMYIDGSCYFIGDWLDGYQTGVGACYDKYGNIIYVGDFENGEPTETYPMSSADLEEYKDYKFECIKYTTGYYVGMTYKGEPHDFGFFMWDSGDLWYGDWENGIREGDGVYIPYNGTVIEGVWHGNDRE